MSFCLEFYKNNFPKWFVTEFWVGILALRPWTCLWGDKPVFVLVHCALDVAYILELNGGEKKPREISKCVLKKWISTFLKIKTENQLKRGEEESVFGAADWSSIQLLYYSHLVYSGLIGWEIGKCCVLPFAGTCTCLLRDLVNTKVLCNVILDRLLGASADLGEKLLQAELQRNYFHSVC